MIIGQHKLSYKNNKNLVTVVAPSKRNHHKQEQVVYGRWLVVLKNIFYSNVPRLSFNEDSRLCTKNKARLSFGRECAVEESLNELKLGEIHR